MSTYIANSVRGGNYDEAIGLDIDGEIVVNNYQGVAGNHLYDYDLLSRPSVSGSGVIIPGEVDAGFPSLSDYPETINPDGSKTSNFKNFLSEDQSRTLPDTMTDRVNNFKNFLSEDQSGSLDTMTDRVNNGRLANVNIVSETKVPENTDIIINKDNRESSIKGILEENSLNSLFFGETNTKVIQDTIRYRVYQNTDQVISNQSPNDLFIIMRSIMLQYANFRTDVGNIVDEIRRLNSKVLDYAVENVSSNVKQHQGYIADLEKLPVPMDMPVYHNKRSFTYDISNLL
jgi:hypothetical protein